MDKLKMQSPNLTDDNIAKLAELFPNCITESRNDVGDLTSAIDFDQLKQELSNNIVDGSQERYQLNWPGKREALLTANKPIIKTLRPCREESVEFDTTENLFIEGDNLDALKLLQETYLGKVKVIYIDPPYNTGKDFIYDDNFSVSGEDYLIDSGQKNQAGHRLVANTDSNGRFHSRWLSMMYPRLKLSRNLLKDDGVLAISIDHNEVANLSRLCDEVMGGDNYIASIANVSNPKGRSDDKFIATSHEYILLYGKNVKNFQAFGFEIGEEIIKRYNKKDKNGNLYREIDLRKTGDGDLREDRRNLFYFFHYNEKTGELIAANEEVAPDGFITIKPIRADGKEGRWRCSLESACQKKSLLQAKFMPKRKIWGIVELDYLADRGRVRATSSWTFKDVNNERGSEAFINLGFDKRTFPSPKPLGTVKRILEVCCPEKSDDLILDFFAGSGSTAHAIMDMNAQYEGSKKFILVQLPETCDEQSEAYKSGYKNIAEISKERIRRAGKKIKEENSNASDLDAGFRVLKVDDSNMLDVYNSPDSLSQDGLSLFSDNIKDDRSSEDLLFQVLLDWGIDLTLPINKETITGREVFFVDGNALAACFDKDGKVDGEFCNELADRNPLRVVFRDAGFKDDSVKINVEQIFKVKSAHSDLKTI